MLPGLFNVVVMADQRTKGKNRTKMQSDDVTRFLHSFFPLSYRALHTTPKLSGLIFNNPHKIDN
jgi:hypothetical protein